MLRVTDLETHFHDPATGGRSKVLDGISFRIREKEILGLVGPSGAGKSTLALCILGMARPTRGQIFFCGRPIDGMKRKEKRAWRKQVQVIWQDPYAYLNPYMRAEALVRELMENFMAGSKRSLKRKSEALLERVGVPPGAWHKRPHQLSGGMCQRVAVARALAGEPRLLVCDEPLSALDVSLQVQILHLLKEFHQKMGLTFLFITHDLDAASYFCPRIAVMHQGKIVETGPAEQIFSTPGSDCARQLVQSRLDMD